MEDEDRYTQEPQFTCQVAQFVRRLLARVADEDQSIDLVPRRFLPRMAENAPDLGLPAEAG